MKQMPGHKGQAEGGERNMYLFKTVEIGSQTNRARG